MLKLLSLMAVWMLAAQPALAEWPAESVELGQRDHPKVLQSFGGPVRNPALLAYVEAVGSKVVAVSSRPDEIWQFTVLDSPEVNAFALPGGYVYVTRGLLALANNESELAAVLAHEITHVIEAHVEARQAAQKDALVDGAVSALLTGLFGGGENRMGNAVRNGVETVFSQLGAYSKEQEFAADAGGIALLKAAGYRPAAQADFLAILAANAALKAELSGRAYDEAAAPIFANHPAPAERQRRARALAGTDDGQRGRAAYLAAINGMIYGQSQRGGFVRGQSFIHPQLGFYFEAPEGLRIQNAARQINILGPNRSTLIMSGGPYSGDLRADLQAWAAQVPLQDSQGRGLAHMRQLEINGMGAITGTISLRKRGRRSVLRLTLIAFNGGVIRFAGTVLRGDEASADLQRQTVQSFAALSAARAAEYVETHVSIHRMQAGETVAELAGQMSQQGAPEQEFRVLNGLAIDESLPAGRLVKLITF